MPISIVLHGGGGGQLLGALGLHGEGSGGIIGNIAASGVGGGILMVIVGFIKKAMAET